MDLLRNWQAFYQNHERNIFQFNHDKQLLLIVIAVELKIQQYFI